MICLGATPEAQGFGELCLKMEKLQQLSDAIRAARRTMEEVKTANAAAAYTRLVEQRRALRKTLPPLKVIS